MKPRYATVVTTDVAAPRRSSGTVAVSTLISVGNSAAVPAAASASPASPAGTPPAPATIAVPAAASADPATMTAVGRRAARLADAKRVTAMTAANTAGPVAATAGRAPSSSSR
jgi:hypothetical protein